MSSTAAEPYFPAPVKSVTSKPSPNHISIEMKTEDSLSDATAVVKKNNPLVVLFFAIFIVPILVLFVVLSLPLLIIIGPIAYIRNPFIFEGLKREVCLLFGLQVTKGDVAI